MPVTYKGTRKVWLPVHPRNPAIGDKVLLQPWYAGEPMIEGRITAIPYPELMEWASAMGVVEVTVSWERIGT